MCISLNSKEFAMLDFRFANSASVAVERHLANTNLSKIAICLLRKLKT